MSGCPFCERIASGTDVLASADAAVAFADAFPVSSGHTLVVPRRHVARLEHLEPDEWRSVFEVVHEITGNISAEADVDGVNVGVNSGQAAGQTVDHAHVHVIPRRTGDVADPRGGVRHLIPDRADYWTGR
jgi:diadenosine tetraphosphate (Ap4A) HIT family hydrolase